MQKFRLIQWCAIATCQIKFDPDRQKVTEELMGHLEDRRDALMAQGLDEKEATSQALEAMGDPKEIAPQLGAIHRPFWGYLLRCSKIALVIILLISLLPIWTYFTHIYHLNSLERYYPFDLFQEASYGSDTGRTLHKLSSPQASFSSDGYRFTVTDVAYFTTYTESKAEGSSRLYFLMDQRSCLPWTETERYYNSLSISAVCNHFTAVDSLGNFYYSYATRMEDDPALIMVCGQSGLFSGATLCWINDFPQDAEWIQICYQRDGRDLSLYIDLTGGAD